MNKYIIPYNVNDYSQEEKPSNQEMLELMKQETSKNNIVNNFVQSTKTLMNLREEKYYHDILQQQVNNLSMLPMHPLVCAPALENGVLWTHLPPDLSRLVFQVSEQTGWPPLAVLMVFLEGTNTACAGGISCVWTVFGKKL